ncbi:hypothetical protein NLN89_21185, partial [Citrobacter portucalensis]
MIHRILKALLGLAREVYNQSCTKTFDKTLLLIAFIHLVLESIITSDRVNTLKEQYELFKKTFTQSVSYVKFKKQTQDTFDFSVLVCSAVPVLKRNIILFEKGVINEITKADYYQPKRDISSEKQKNINTDLKRR